MIGFLLLAPLLFNGTGLIDTFLTKLFKNNQDDGVLYDGTGTLMLISGIIPLIFSLLVGIFWYYQVFQITTTNIYILILCGVVYGLAAYPYFLAFHHDNIENIIPILQTIPLFAYILGYIFLGEYLSSYQVGIISLIVLFTILFGRNFEVKKMNRKSVLLILLSSLLYAISYLLFKIGGGEWVNIMGSYFWQYIGVAVGCLSLTINKKIRSTTYIYFQNNGRKFSLLNITNEIFFIIGVAIVNYFSLIYPLAIVNTLSQGLQPILGFLMTYICFKLLPNIFEREYQKSHIYYKIGLCIISFALLGLFFHST